MPGGRARKAPTWRPPDAIPLPPQPHHAPAFSFPSSRTSHPPSSSRASRRRDPGPRQRSRQHPTSQPTHRGPGSSHRCAMLRPGRRKKHTVVPGEPEARPGTSTRIPPHQTPLQPSRDPGSPLRFGRDDGSAVSGSRLFGRDDDECVSRSRFSPRLKAGVRPGRREEICAPAGTTAIVERRDMT